jgi:hypothetical protein
MRSIRSANTVEYNDQGESQMIRRLLILAAIAALFTIVTVVPASAIALNNPDGTASYLSTVPQD